MARIESLCIGGYYPTPTNITQLIVSHITKNARVTIVDPCAGEGEVAFTLKHIFPSSILYMIEMEKTRFLKIKKNCGYNDHALHGDFFNVHYDTGPWDGADLMWLNPPYDYDKEYKRLEERFLVKATPMLPNDGVLVFIIPHYALAASAETLSTNYKNIMTWKFPEPEWNSYKQVVVFASKTTRSDVFTNERDLFTLKKYSEDHSIIPVLKHEAAPYYHVPSSGGFRDWRNLSLDSDKLKIEYEPWESECGPVIGISPPEDGMFNKIYPVASPPRAVHLSAALSAGIFNGIRVKPNPGFSQLPDLLVKGVFDKEFRGIDDKLDKKGNKVGEVQVQQPKLSVTILDLSKGKFHEVTNGDSLRDEPVIDDMSMRELLDWYGQSLMKEMMKSCPVLHDPNNDPNPIPMPELREPLFPPQEECVRAVLKLREKYPDRGVIILGEIGSGKTRLALASAKAMGKKKIIVMCPPHLLDSWDEQIQAVIPEAKSHVLKTIKDIQNFAEINDNIMNIGLLSREKAKLHHGWDSINGECPDCNKPVSDTKNHAKTRSICENVTIEPNDKFAQWLSNNCIHFMPYLPTHDSMKVLSGKYLHKMVRKYQKEPKTYYCDNKIEQAIGELVKLVKESSKVDKDLLTAISWTAPQYGVELARILPEVCQTNYDVKSEQLKILLSVKPSDLGEARAEFRDEGYVPDYMGYSSWKNKWEMHHGAWSGEQRVSDFSYSHFTQEVEYKGIKRGSAKALSHLLDTVISCAKFKSAQCGCVLYSASGPYRFALAPYIQKKYPRCYDMLVLDEAHEFSNRDSAQTSAAQHLMRPDIPVLLLTGSLLNGYAESVYMNMYGISPEFRSRFGRSGVSKFIDRYGYWKQLVQDKDVNGKIVEFGSQSSRVIRSARKCGVSPGILPLFQLEYILPCAVTLQKEDLSLNIPPRVDEQIALEADGDLLTNYNQLLADLKAEIKRTKFIPGLAGKLWGAMARLPSYLDLAAVGNGGDRFELRWPKSASEMNQAVISSVPLLNPNELLPKEYYAIERIREEINEGRNVILLCWHKALIKRMLEECEDNGFKVAYLDPAKVPTDIRQDWIDKNVVAKGVQVMVCNPIVIQTGLNNLVHFSTQVWMENPICDAIVLRQARGRIDRIGQTEYSNIIIPIYTNTLQDKQYTLLMHKVGVSESVDGLDPEEALRSAGVIDSDFMGFSVGKQLYNMLMDDDNE